MALVVSDILPIWRKSGKYLIPLPGELAGVVGHGDVVEVIVIHPDGDRYVLRGVVKVWRSGRFIQLPARKAKALGRGPFRVRIHVG